MRPVNRSFRQLAVFLLLLCCLTAQSVSVVAAPCSMNEHSGNSAPAGHAEPMAAMDGHAHHAMMQEGVAAASDCCNDQENCSMTFCYSSAVMLNSDFSADNLEAASAYSVIRVANVRTAHTLFFKPPISL